jgi:hypothetical protein
MGQLPPVFLMWSMTQLYHVEQYTVDCRSGNGFSCINVQASVFQIKYSDQIRATIFKEITPPPPLMWGLLHTVSRYSFYHEIYGSDRSSVKYNSFVYMMLTKTLLCVLYSVPRPSMDVNFPHDRKDLIFLHEKHYYD